MRRLCHVQKKCIRNWGFRFNRQQRKLKAGITPPSPKADRVLIMVLAVESIAACVLFTVLLEIAAFHRREAFVNDYPPVVTEKLRQMGLIAEKPPAKRSDMIRKMIAFIVYAVLFSLLLRYVNGITTLKSWKNQDYCLIGKKADYNLFKRTDMRR